MDNIQFLEVKYLEWKIAYYSGNPLATDAEFDALEEVLKKANSPVVKQVGMKRSEFDFPHPTPMYSLNKIQTEETSSGIDFKTSEVLKWAEARCKKLGIDLDQVEFEYSPKYDGNAVNVIYIGKKLHKILSRSDQNFGKDLTEKLKTRLSFLINLEADENDISEMRCEAVIKKDVFNEKYSTFANPRNLVAGIVGRDDLSEAINDIYLKPISRLLNHEYIFQLFPNFLYSHIWDYEKIIKTWINKRNSFDYQLDGIVISFPVEYRKQLGANEHDPEWSIAIKFVPEHATTILEDIEIAVGKSGEVTPVGILKPVILAGTTVSRVSLYNIGFVIKNKLGKGSVISIQKAGDIIPEIKTIIIPAEKTFDIPAICPSCGEDLILDDIHLICNNPACKAKLTRLLDYHFKILKLKGVGEKSIDEFANRGFTIVDLIEFVRTKGNIKEEIEPFGFSYGSRSHEIFVNIFKSIKSIDFEIIPIFLGINNAGRKLSKQVALYYCNQKFDWSNQERALVEFFEKPETKLKVFDLVKRLNEVGIEINLPVQKIVSSTKVVLTGSPKDFGFKTKEEFIKIYNLEESSLSDAEYLITDSYSSTSAKMELAKKKNVKIITYSDFKNIK